MNTLDMTGKGLAANHIFLFLTALVAIVIQLPELFFGVELCDSGFYLTFYEYALSDPAAVSYNYMYPLTGIVGGLLHTVPGLDNMFAMRIVGLLVNTVSAVSAVWLVQWFCPRYRWAAVGGIVMILAGAWDYPLTFYYDHLSSMMMVGGLTLMGLSLFCTCGKRACLLMFFAGLAIGLNAYSRLPNVIDMVVVVIIPLYGLITGDSHNRLMLPFMVGWLAGMAVGLLVVWCVAGETFWNTVRQLVDIGAGAGGETSHSIGNLLYAQIAAWRRILIVSLIMAVGYVCLWLFLRLKVAAMKLILLAVLTAGFIYLLLLTTPVTMVAAFSLVGCVGILLYCRRHRMLVFYSVAGLFMMALLPLGSDNGIYNGGTLSLWVAAVGASSFLVAAMGVENPCNQGKYGLCALSAFVVLFCLSTGWKVYRNGFYFDPTSVTEMDTEVCVPEMKGIYTSAERANLVSRIVREVSGELGMAQEVMIYGSGPMFNYLLHKRPAFGNSWPEQLSEGELRKSLAAYRSNPETSLPYIVMLKFNTIGAVDFIPSDTFMKGEDEMSNIYHNSSKSRVVLEFIQAEGYRTVMEDKYFNVYAPPERVR